MSLPTVYVVMYSVMVDSDEPVPVAVFPDKHSAKVWINEQDWPDDFFLKEVPMHPESALSTCGNPEKIAGATSRMKITFPKRPKYTCDKCGYKLSYAHWYGYWFCNKCNARYLKVQFPIMVMEPDDE